MRKILLSVVACCALIAFVPASALAHGHHHKRHHRAHHARVRDFGSTSSSQSSQGTSQNQDQTAGTVQSFSKGVLTIALNDGSMVSGQVTSDTEIECQAADMSSSLRSHDHGGDNGGGDQGDDDNGQGDDDNGQGDDDNGQGDDNAGQACDLSTVPQGTVVQEAELRISSAGAVWKKVDLMTASAADNDNDNGADNDNDGD
jgi:hypothetical protein